MSDLARHSQGLGRKPALLLVDLVRGFTDPACPLGSEAEAVGDRNPEAHAANLFDLNAKYADVIELNEVLDLLEML
jgi:hypothetical protein